MRLTEAEYASEAAGGDGRGLGATGRAELAIGIVQPKVKRLKARNAVLRIRIISAGQDERSSASSTLRGSIRVRRAVNTRSQRALL